MLRRVIGDGPQCYTADQLRAQGEARLKRWLKSQLKQLRAENDARRPKRYDMDDESGGFEAALDAFDELLAKRRAP